MKDGCLFSDKDAIQNDWYTCKQYKYKVMEVIKNGVSDWWNTGG